VRRADLDARGGAEMQVMPKRSPGAAGAHRHDDREWLHRIEDMVFVTGIVRYPAENRPATSGGVQLKRDASSDRNSSRIHFPVPLRTDVRLPDYAADGTWVVKMFS
jgi:hypothetical protein